MPSWYLKTAVQRVISWLPRSRAWNRLFQAYATRSIALSPVHFETKVKECHGHWQAFASHYPKTSDLAAFELGTGWFPIIPIGLSSAARKRFGRSISLRCFIRRE